ncbi:50S ribosomal protein L28 [endosymbiont of Sipalinus gigas]|uniref:50S ribosomal protein L28 n=1 Tax=endosymbiont of Sipalinus gigas TaxID=1972134 RepID=UPI000DC71F8D|nr:50S ribosomal protein L28 [endosymbiont of Sipalinus gigas]BBA85327.1 50S ribosomal protein L28 [endosymbiont of Sipalinus gigas]
MSKICKLTNKKSIFGNNRSNSMNKTSRKFNINFQKKKVYFPNINKFLKIKLSIKGLKLLYKKIKNN